jgi:hypothetical protein
VDEIRISPQGDPFYAAKLSRPHAGPDEPEAPHGCYEGWVYLGELVEDPETGDEVEIVEAVPCRRCNADFDEAL